jgi:DNA repair protein RadD
MKKTLRPHQREAIKAIIDSLRAGKVPVASCSVGFGKSLVLADLCEKALKQGKRVLQLVPTKELCEQNYLEMFEHTDFKQDIGICCAKLNKYQTKHNCVIATNTSFLSRRAKSGAFDLLLVDEAHLFSPTYESTYQKIYRSLLRLNQNLKMVGVT